MKWWGWIFFLAVIAGSWLYGDRVQAWENKHVLMIVWILFVVACAVGDYSYQKLRNQIDELNNRIAELQHEHDESTGEVPEF